MSERTKQPKLKPCPFCGGLNIIIVSQLPPLIVYAQCAECGGKGPFSHASEGDKKQQHRHAARRWNTRRQP